MMSVRALQEVFFDEVCDDLCVGLCGEAVALFDELPLQRNIVLDNSVVHHYHAPAAIAVRMGVLFGGAAVGCPAGVADAVSSIERFQADNFFQIPQLAFGAANLKSFPVAAHSYARRVVAAILQALEPINNDRHDSLVTHVSNDATHLELLACGEENQFSDQSSRVKRNSSITGFVSTSLAMRATSASASVRLRPPLSVSSKYFPWRTSFNSL